MTADCKNLRRYNRTMQKKLLITVKEAAKLLEVNPETLRRWDKQGKFKTKRHPMNNYRVYKLGEVGALRRKINA